jgi:flagellar protein FliO/FliZ
MTAYFVNLIVMLLLVAGLAIGSLWLWRRVQPGMAQGRERLVKVVDAVPLGTTGRLAVVEFGGRHILLAVARGRIDKLGEAEIGGEFIDDGGEPVDAVRGAFDRLVRRP